jgi:plastocyanin
MPQPAFARSEVGVMRSSYFRDSMKRAARRVAVLGFAASPVHGHGMEPSQELSLRLGEYHFGPDTLQVHAGRPVRLTLSNTDTLTPHNFTLKDTDAGLNIDADVSAGRKTVVKFTPVKAGRYVFFRNKKLPFMKSHRERGMEGTLEVLPATPD